MDHKAPARLISGLHISTSSPLFHILSPLLLLLPSPLLSFTTLPSLSSFPLLPPGLSSLRFPPFFLPSLFSLPQMNWRARSPPATVDLGLRDTAVVYIYFFSIVMVIIIINIIATEQFTHTHTREVADGYSGARGAAHGRTSSPHHHRHPALTTPTASF